MTKYILHGGYEKLNALDNDTFYQEMTLGKEGAVSILLTYFARDGVRIEEQAEFDKQKFTLNSTNKDLVFEIAQLEKFSDQVAKADIILLAGGKTEKLMDALSKVPNLKELFSGKTVAGSSAGAYALSKYYFGNNSKQLGEGLGILNFKTYCHYSAEDKEAVNQLANYQEPLPILVLPDTKWVVFFE